MSLNTFSVNDVLSGCSLVTAQATTATFTSKTIDTRKMEHLSITSQLTADSGAARVGALKVQVTDDPRALSDPGNAAWADMVLRVEEVGSPGSPETAEVSSVAIDENAGVFRFAFTVRGSYVRLVYTSSTAGTDGALTAWVKGG